MVQIYSIFINRRRVTLQENPCTLLIENSNKVRILNSKTDYQLVIDELFNAESENEDLILVDKNRSINDFFTEFRSFFNVHVAAGGVVENACGEFLFIFRRGKCDLPKGHRENNETLEETAIREVAEETGVSQLSITDRLPVTYHIYVEKGQRVFKETHWFKMTVPCGKQKLVPQVEEDISRVEWLQKKDFQTVRANTYPNLLQIIDSVEKE